MVKKKHRLIFARIPILLLCIFSFFPDKVQAQCGADIYILNDNSGSVDARELQQSKQFITRLAIAMAPLGTGNNQTRIAISNFASTGTFTEFNFPIAASRYTTDLADIIHYEHSSRVLSGGTDVANATQQASLVAGQPVIPARNVAQILVILTDAYNYQVAPSIVQFAENLKTQGFSIIVMAIDEAVSIPHLQQMASPGGYFTAIDYQTIEDDVIAYAQSLAAQACTYQPPTPRPDLNIVLSNFTLENCITTPTASVNYQVNNNGAVSFSGNLILSLYDADPRAPGANLVGVHNAGAVSVASGGSSSGAITSGSIANLISASRLYAIVNFDGSQAGNQVPVPAQLSESQLAVTTPVAEIATTNNFSPAANIILGTGCNTAILDMAVSANGGACENEVTYTLQVCNNGLVDATLNGLLVDPAPGFNLLSGSELCAGVDPAFSQLGQDLTGNIADDDFFVSAFSSDGHTIVASGLKMDNGATTDAGGTRVYNYNQVSGQWVQRGQTIYGPTASSWMGFDNDITPDGNRIIIGGYGYSSRRGIVQVYDWNSGLGQWEQVGNSIIGNAGNDDLRSVAISGNGQRLIVGARNGIGNAGRATVYELIGNTWTQMGAAFLGAPDDNLANPSWPKAISISNDGSRIFMGAFKSDAGGLTENGHTEVYDWNGSSWIAKPFVNGLNNNDSDGWGVSATPDGNTFASFANRQSGGSDYIRVFDWNGSSWVQRGATISVSGIYSIDLSETGNRLAVGRGSSASQLYEFDGSQWVLIESFPGVIGLNSSINGNGTVVAFGDDAANSSTGLIKVFSQDPCLIAPGECLTAEYTYDVSGATAGTYDFDVVLEAGKVNPAHANPVINPDKNFSTQNGVTTGDGWDGSSHSEEDVTLFGTAFCSTTHAIDIAVNIAPSATCTGSFATATVTITNPYPINITGTNLVLNLGNGTTYVSEPYNRNGILLPTFPGLNGTTALDTIPVYSLAPGSNTFDIDIAVANGVNTLAAQLTAIDPAYNNGAATTTQVSDNVTGQANPTITGTCPADITFGTTTVNLNYSVSGAATMLWSSGTNGTFSSPNSGITDYTINLQDQANGFVDFTLMAVSATGCDNVSFCRININDVSRDYGDAPVSYDIDASAIPVAAAHAITPGLHLGILAPGAELQNQPSALADTELEDDGLLIASMYLPSGATSFSLPISVTNTTAGIGYANAFIDWNNNGNFLDEHEAGTIVPVPAASGTNTYSIEFTVPSGLTLPLNPYIRLRVAYEAAAIRRSFGAAAGGEIEDFFVRASVPVTGTVFDDMNTNTIIDGAEEGTTAGADLYVYLVNASGIIIDSAKVATNGTYQLNAAPDGSYTIHLSEVEYGLGHNTNTTTINTTPPNGWTTTGENGAGNTGPGDGTPDGVLAVNVGTTDVSQQNFGLQTSNPLPVTLLSFNASKSGADALLQWITVKEDNNAGFVVENSKDGVQWLPLGFVPAQKAGNSTSKVYYDFKHIEPGTGKQYYRLKQIDADGQVHYSSISILNFDVEQALHVYPNPAKANITITGLKVYDKLCIYEMTGRLVKTIHLNDQDVLEIDLSTYSSGVYNLKVSNKQGLMQTFRIVKD